jgi:hypothetical protein
VSGDNHEPNVLSTGDLCQGLGDIHISPEHGAGPCVLRDQLRLESVKVLIRQAFTSTLQMGDGGLVFVREGGWKGNLDRRGDLNQEQFDVRATGYVRGDRDCALCSRRTIEGHQNAFCPEDLGGGWQLRGDDQQRRWGVRGDHLRRCSDAPVQVPSSAMTRKDEQVHTQGLGVVNDALSGLTFRQSSLDGNARLRALRR